MEQTSIALAAFRSRRTLTTLWRMRLYVLANFVVPTFDCTRSCNSVAVVFSSSANTATVLVIEVGGKRAGNAILTYLGIANNVLLYNSIEGGQYVNEESLKSSWFHVRCHSCKPTENG
jgi:hypothetical protein